mgnify:CR=1 FL=1
MKIAIIDDEKDICFILNFELKSKGFNPITFNSALEAQAYFETESADAVICDFQMPKMSGLDFFNWLQQRNIKIPFYILTGEPNMDTHQLLERGISDVLFKPQDLKKISTLLNNI